MISIDKSRGDPKNTETRKFTMYETISTFNYSDDVDRILNVNILSELPNYEMVTLTNFKANEEGEFKQYRQSIVIEVKSLRAIRKALKEAERMLLQCRIRHQQTTDDC
jgi:hypothetical protein